LFGVRVTLKRCVETTKAIEGRARIVAIESERQWEKRNEKKKRITKKIGWPHSVVDPPTPTVWLKPHGPRMLSETIAFRRHDRPRREVPGVQPRCRFVFVIELDVS